jgi:hypothetical protein
MAPFHLAHLCSTGCVVTIVVDNARLPDVSVSSSAVDPLPALRRCELLDFKKSRRRTNKNKSSRTPIRSVNRWDSQADVKALSLMTLPFQRRNATNIVNSVLNSPSLAKNRWNSESYGKDLTTKSPPTTILRVPFPIGRNNSSDSACSLPIRLPSPKYHGAADSNPRKPRRFLPIDTTALLKEALDISESSWSGSYANNPPGHILLLHHHHQQQHQQQQQQLVLSTE